MNKESSIEEIDYSRLRLEDLNEELAILREALREANKTAAISEDQLIKGIATNCVAKLLVRIKGVEAQKRIRGYSGE